MTTQNEQLARRGYEALMQGEFEVLEDLMAPDLTWHWWERGPWDCHSREEALVVIKERLGQNAIGDLREVTELGEGRVLVVTGLPPDSEISPEDLGPSRGPRRDGQRGHDSRRQGDRDAGLPQPGRGDSRGSGRWRRRLMGSARGALRENQEVRHNYSAIVNLKSDEHPQVEAARKACQTALHALRRAGKARCPVGKPLRLAVPVLALAVLAAEHRAVVGIRREHADLVAVGVHGDCGAP